jgi:hypothetical protein
MAILIDRAKTQIAIEPRDMQIIQFHIRIFARTERASSINAHCRGADPKAGECIVSLLALFGVMQVDATQSMPPNVTRENYILLRSTGSFDIIQNRVEQSHVKYKPFKAIFTTAHASIKNK